VDNERDELSMGVLSGNQVLHFTFIRAIRLNFVFANEIKSMSAYKE